MEEVRVALTNHSMDLSQGSGGPIPSAQDLKIADTGSQASPNVISVLWPPLPGELGGLLAHNERCRVRASRNREN
jgi:hypothetical protein